MKKIFLCLLISLSSQIASADFMEVQLLGTGTPRPSIERFGAATLVAVGGKYYLFDAGRGATIRLQQAGVLPSQIEQVFITHLHSDHVSGLADLWLTGWVWQRPVRLTLNGPAGTVSLAENLHKAYQKDLQFRNQNTGLDLDLAEINSKEVEEGRVYQKDGVEITAFRVDHDPVTPAYGYRIEFGDRCVVISGDTTYSASLIENAKNCDVLIHEVVMAAPMLLKRNRSLQKVVAYHTTAKQLSEVFTATQPRLGVLSHVLNFGVTDAQILQQVEAGYSGRVALGEDLMKIEIGQDIRVRPALQ